MDNPCSWKWRIKLYTWQYADRLMAWLVRKIEAVPPRTWNAIVEQPWFFSKRQDAQKKLGVEILYNPDTNQLVSRVTRQPEGME